MYTQNLSEYSLTLFFTFYSDSDIAVEQIAQRDRVYFSREVVYKSFFLSRVYFSGDIQDLPESLIFKILCNVL